MTAPDEALRELALAATPGPWCADVRDGERLCGLDGPNHAEVLLAGRVDCMAYCYGGTSRIEGDNIEADAAFIAAANPTAVLALLDERDALREAVERVRALAESWRSLPVWGPDERGLMILDHVDHDGIMRELRTALDGPQ